MPPSPVGVGHMSAAGWRTSSNADIDTICSAVFHLPSVLTLTAWCVWGGGARVWGVRAGGIREGVREGCPTVAQRFVDLHGLPAWRGATVLLESGQPGLGVLGVRVQWESHEERGLGALRSKGDGGLAGSGWPRSRAVTGERGGGAGRHSTM